MIIKFKEVTQTRASIRFVTPCNNVVSCPRLSTAFAHRNIRFTRKHGDMVLYQQTGTTTPADPSDQFQQLLLELESTFTENPLEFVNRDQAHQTHKPLQGSSGQTYAIHARR